MISGLVADTSLIINFFNGHITAIESLTSRDIWISGVTEIELLASSKLTEDNRSLIRDFIGKIYVVGLEKRVKEYAIEMRRKYKLKLSDSVIAATSLYLKMPLYTFDGDFSRVSEIADLVILEL